MALYFPLTTRKIVFYVSGIGKNLILQEYIFKKIEKQQKHSGYICTNCTAKLGCML